jgi:hypothetical protein
VVGVVVLLLVGTKAQMGEDTGDVIVHGRGYPLILLHEVSVVRKVLADMLLLLAQSIDSGWLVHDPLHDRVLITITCQS